MHNSYCSKSLTQFYEAILIWLLWTLSALSLSFPTLLSPSFSNFSFINLPSLHPPCSPAFQDLCLESLSLFLCWVILQLCHYFLPEASGHLAPRLRSWGGFGSSWARPCSVSRGGQNITAHSLFNPQALEQCLERTRSYE